MLSAHCWVSCISVLLSLVHVGHPLGAVEWQDDPQLLLRVQEWMSGTSAAGGLRTITPVPQRAATRFADLHSLNRPAVFTTLSADLTARQHLSTWRSKPSFIADHGQERTVARWPFGSHAFGILGREVRVDNFLDSMHHPKAGMIFHKSSIGSLDWRVPDSLRAMESTEYETDSIVSIGGSRQGLPFHSHGSTWEAVVHGLKIVVLVRPSEFLSDAAMNALFPAPTGDPLILLEQVDQLRQMDGVEVMGHLLKPGEVIFIPCFWWHATLNIGDTIAVGRQLLNDEHSRPPRGDHCPREYVNERLHGMPQSLPFARRACFANLITIGW